MSWQWNVDAPPLRASMIHHAYKEATTSKGPVLRGVLAFNRGLPIKPCTFSAIRGRSQERKAQKSTNWENPK